MLDFVEGRTYEIGPDTKVLIRPTEVAPALEATIRATERPRTETQRFITERYDRLFFLVSQLEAAVRTGLVRREDVRFPLSWYIEKRFCKHKKLILDYIAENSADEARQFFESLDAWQRCSG
jgi:hypothetical protein